MTVFFQRFRRDIAGIVWLATSLFLALSLMSFQATDPSFNSIGTGLKVHNFCGYFGSFLADLLYQLFGISAWLLVVGAARMSWLTFKGALTQFGGARAVWATLLLIT